jgi:hypothetical protein
MVWCSSPTSHIFTPYSLFTPYSQLIHSLFAHKKNTRLPFSFLRPASRCRRAVARAPAYSRIIRIICIFAAYLVINVEIETEEFERDETEEIDRDGTHPERKAVVVAVKVRRAQRQPETPKTEATGEDIEALFAGFEADPASAGAALDVDIDTVHPPKTELGRFGDAALQAAFDGVRITLRGSKG